MTAKLILFSAFIISMLLMSVNLRRKRNRIFFFGDSITRQGDKHGGYIKQLAEYLANEGLDDKFELVGKGIDGNTITDLCNRVNSDIIAKGADVVIIVVGVNDVWHRYKLAGGTEATNFNIYYRQLVEQLLAVQIKVVLCTPTVIGEQPGFEQPEDQAIDELCDIIRQITQDYHLPLVDLRNAFKMFLQEHNFTNKKFGLLTNDTVHLNYNGNQLVANTMWAVLKEHNLLSPA